MEMNFQKKLKKFFGQKKELLNIIIGDL